MKVEFKFIMNVCLGLLLSSGAAAATPDELQRQIEELRAELQRLAGPGDASRLAELERRIDLLAQELEKGRTGGATEEAGLAGVQGLAPAASKVYRKAQGVSIGGYGEAVYENYARQRQDGADSGKLDQADFVRQIVYVGYKFDERTLINSELEFEHASTGKGGEVSVEFAYVDFQPSKSVGLRAGMVLLPLGFLNELHEPPIFHGARRPEVEQAIIPSTWRENGAGLFGEVGDVQWRAYVTAGLLGSGITSGGIRGARQSGARSKAEDFAFSGRLDWHGAPGLLLGGAFYTGNSGQGARVEGQPLGARVSLFEAHAQYDRRGLQLRALAAKGSLGDAALLNGASKLTGNKSVGEDQWGYYVQAAYDVLARSGRRTSLTPFLRFEQLDTQDGVPAGFSKDPAAARSALTLGVGAKPHRSVVLKADWQRLRNDARSGVSQWNLGVGYLF